MQHGVVPLYWLCCASKNDQQINIRWLCVRAGVHACECVFVALTVCMCVGGSLCMRHTLCICVVVAGLVVSNGDIVHVCGFFQLGVVFPPPLWEAWCHIPAVQDVSLPPASLTNPLPAHTHPHIKIPMLLPITLIAAPGSYKGPWGLLFM